MCYFADAFGFSFRTIQKREKNGRFCNGQLRSRMYGNGMDGTQLIKVWGFGKKPDKAAYQAKKNAVHAVVFKGINGGKPGCMTRPLVTKPGAEVQHSDYFQTFFSNGGHYLNFVAQSGDGTMDRIKVGKKQYKVGVIVSVRHAALRRELETAGIINKLGGGF
jgi:hypothetical protein